MATAASSCTRTRVSSQANASLARSPVPVAIEPLPLGQHEAAGPVAPEVVVQQSIERGGIAPRLGVDPTGQRIVEGLQAADARTLGGRRTSATWLIGPPRGRRLRKTDRIVRSLDAPDER